MSKLILKNVRLSFSELFEPVSKFDGPEKFSACFIIDPKSDDGKANLAGFKKIVRALEAEKFGGDELPTDKLPIQDGSAKDYSGWAGNVVISAANKKRPVIVGRKRQPVAEGDVDTPYAGCYVNAVVDLWALNARGVKRIVASLEAVQFAADGEPFTASNVDVKSDFDDIGGDDSITTEDVEDAFTM
ncbi:MAG: ssDNA-binding protein [Akkermansiaceae bacterium]